MIAKIPTLNPSLSYWKSSKEETSYPNVSCKYSNLILLSQKKKTEKSNSRKMNAGILFFTLVVEIG